MSHDRRGGGRGYQSRGRREHPCDKVNVKPDLLDGEHIAIGIFTDDARKIAECIKTKRSNLRNAYDKLVDLRMRMITDKENLPRLREGLGKIQRWAEAQASRKNAPVDGFTRRFIVENCERTTNFRELEGFYELFQSVLAYLRGT